MKRLKRIIDKFPRIGYFSIKQSVHDLFKVFGNKYKSSDSLVKLNKLSFDFDKQNIVSLNFLDHNNFKRVGFILGVNSAQDLFHADRFRDLVIKVFNKVHYFIFFGNFLFTHRSFGRKRNN